MLSVPPLAVDSGTALPLAVDSGTAIVLAGIAVLVVVGALSFVVRFSMLLGTVQGPDVPAEEKTNCPACGARVAAVDRCGYCGESLPGADGGE